MKSFRRSNRVWKEGNRHPRKIHFNRNVIENFRAEAEQKSRTLDDVITLKWLEEIKQNWADVEEIFELLRRPSIEVTRNDYVTERQQFSERFEGSEAEQRLRNLVAEQNLSRRFDELFIRYEPGEVPAISEQNNLDKSGHRLNEPDASDEDGDVNIRDEPPSELLSGEEFGHAIIRSQDSVIAFILSEYLSIGRSNENFTRKKVFEILSSPRKNELGELRKEVRYCLGGLDWVMENSVGFFSHLKGGGIAIDLEHCLKVVKENFAVVDVKKYHSFLIWAFFHESFHSIVYSAFSSVAGYEKYRGALHHCTRFGDCFDSKYSTYAYASLLLTDRVPKLKQHFGCTEAPSRSFYGYPLEEALANAYSFEKLSTTKIPPSIQEEFRIFSRKQTIGYAEWDVFSVGSRNWDSGLLDLHRLGVGVGINFQKFPYPPPNSLHDHIVRRKRGVPIPNSELETSATRQDIVAANEFFRLAYPHDAGRILFFNLDAAVEEAKRCTDSEKGREIISLIKNIRYRFDELI